MESKLWAAALMQHEEASSNEARSLPMPCQPYRHAVQGQP